MVLVGKPKHSRGFALIAVAGFFVGIIGGPAIVWVWPSPSYYGQLFDFSDVRLSVAVRFVSQGPIATGNPISVHSLVFYGFCPLWNITAFSLWITGYNASATGLIQISRSSTYLIGCAFLDSRSNPSIGLMSSGEGSVVFFSSGSMPLIMGLNVTHAGGWYYNISDSIPATGQWTPRNSIPVEPSESLYSFQNLRFLIMSIVVGGMLTGWFPSIEALERTLQLLRRR